MENKTKTKAETNKAVILLVGLFFILSFFSFNLISAAQETIFNVYPEGYTIAEQQIEYVALNEDIYYNFFLTNTSNGIIITNATVNCSYFLADLQGNEIYYSKINYITPMDTLGYWQVIIDGGNITELGVKHYGVYCADGYGGSLSGSFEVTSSGFEGIPTEWMLVIAMLIGIGLIIFSFYTREYAPLGMASFLFLALSLFIFTKGFGALSAKNLISQFIAGICLLLGAYLAIKTLEEFK